MAYCNGLLKKYDDANRLEDEKEKCLREKRDELGEIIKNYFIDKGMKAPEFKGQGSFTMRTIINPKDDDKMYDIDYGVYINKDDLLNEDDSLKTSFTAQNWVKAAVDKYNEKNGTEIEEVKHKNKCIRVIYKKEACDEKFHVDLPVYYKDEDICYLAVKDQQSESSHGWEQSDPRAIVDWFRNEVKEENKGEQYRRIIRYLKNWTALQSWNNTKPTGLLWTVLVSKNFYEADNSDDISLVETATKIKGFLNQVNPDLRNPVDENEKLLENYTTSAIEALVNKLDRLIEKGSEAIKKDENNLDEAEGLWQDIFSDLELDAPVDNISENKSLVTRAPAIIGNANRSA